MGSNVVMHILNNMRREVLGIVGYMQEVGGKVVKKVGREWSCGDGSGLPRAPLRAFVPHEHDHSHLLPVVPTHLHRYSPTSSPRPCIARARHCLAASSMRRGPALPRSRQPFSHQPLPQHKHPPSPPPIPIPHARMATKRAVCPRCEGLA